MGRASLSMLANELPKRTILTPTNKVITPPRLQPMGFFLSFKVLRISSITDGSSIILEISIIASYLFLLF